MFLEETERSAPHQPRQQQRGWASALRPGGCAALGRGGGGARGAAATSGKKRGDIPRRCAGHGCSSLHVPLTLCCELTALPGDCQLFNQENVRLSKAWRKEAHPTPRMPRCLRRKPESSYLLVPPADAPRPRGTRPGARAESSARVSSLSRRPAACGRHNLFP